MYCYTQSPQPCNRPSPTHASAGDSWTLPGKSGSVSCGVTAPFPWVLVHTVLFLPSKRLYLQSCVSSGGSMVGLMATSSKRAYGIPRSTAPSHTQVCCTQSSCPCNSSLLTHKSTGDAQMQFCLSLCGVSGSWCSQRLFKPSEHLWHEWGLSLNVNSHLLPSCWGFSFALGCRVSPHSRSSATQPWFQCCTAYLL